MKPAAWPRDQREDERLLLVDAITGSLSHQQIRDLADPLEAGDVVVINDAGTLPAAIPFVHRGVPVELRLVSAEDDGSARAILFGETRVGMQTEDAPPAPVVRKGEILDLGEGVRAEVTEVDAVHPRLVSLRFGDTQEALVRLAVRRGRPIQYAYVKNPLPLFHVQTSFASRGWAVEMPCAGRPITFALLRRLRDKGVEVVPLTHAAGLSSTGDASLDARLPLRERYEIPLDTAEAIARAKMNGRRVIAIGTSVVRALESSARVHGRVEAGQGSTELLLGRDERPSVVDGILTGMHHPGTSHYALLEGFTSDPILTSAWDEANRAEYLEHEFGDSMLVLSPAARGSGDKRAA